LICSIIYKFFTIGLSFLLGWAVNPGPVTAMATQGWF
jgi:hypothetical protein